MPHLVISETSETPQFYKLFREPPVQKELRSRNIDIQYRNKEHVFVDVSDVRFQYICAVVPTGRVKQESKQELWADVLSLGDLYPLHQWISQQSPELRNEMLAKSPSVLRFIPEQTDAMVRDAVSSVGAVLEFVSPSLRSPEVCMLAVKKNGWSLRWVPEELRTDELCRAAIKQSGYALQWVPRPIATDEFCICAVQQDGWALQFVSAEQQRRCPAIVDAAIAQHDYAARWRL